MVKVIETNPDSSVAKRTVCKHCGALLEYVPRDVTPAHGFDYGGTPYVREYITCPNCTEETTVRER